VGLHVEYPSFLSDSNEVLIFKFNLSNLMKIRPVGAEMFHADRQTEMMRLTVAFRTFTSRPTKNRVCLAGGKNVSVFMRQKGKQV
jgi:hypothetical protein